MFLKHLVALKAKITLTGLMHKSVIVLQLSVWQAVQ